MLLATVLLGGFGGPGLHSISGHDVPVQAASSAVTSQSQHNQQQNQQHSHSTVNSTATAQSQHNEQHSHSTVTAQSHHASVQAAIDAACKCADFPHAIGMRMGPHTVVCVVCVCVCVCVCGGGALSLSLSLWGGALCGCSVGGIFIYSTSRQWAYLLIVGLLVDPAEDAVAVGSGEGSTEPDPSPRLPG